MLLSRGGQGGVTAAKIIANAALFEGKESQAIPKYGAERRGAPVTVAIRISDEPIRMHSLVREADHVIAFEPGLLQTVAPEQIKDLKTISLNAPAPVDLPFKYEGPVGYADAIEVGNEFGLRRAGIVITSTIMAAVFAKTTGLVSLDSILRATGKMIKDKSVLQANQDAVKAAFERTQIST